MFSLYKLLSHTFYSKELIKKEPEKRGKTLKYEVKRNYYLATLALQTSFILQLLHDFLRLIAPLYIVKSIRAISINNFKEELYKIYFKSKKK